MLLWELIESLSGEFVKFLFDQGITKLLFIWVGAKNPMVSHSLFTRSIKVTNYHLVAKIIG